MTTYTELYLQRKSVQARIESFKNQIKMGKKLEAQLNRQIRQHLTKKAFQSITGAEHDENNRITAHTHNQID